MGLIFRSTKHISWSGTKAIFKLNKYLYKFTFVSPKHKLELFDKLISPVLNYSGEVWGFCHAKMIERVHMQFSKTKLGVKKKTLRMISCMGNWDDLIILQKAISILLNTGLKF